MAIGRIPGPLASPLHAGQSNAPGHVVGVPGPLGAGARVRGQGPHHARGNPGPMSPPRLVRLRITHGARRGGPGQVQYESFLCVNESVIVLAETEPDHWPAWTQIRWGGDAGKPITGAGNGWSIPRSKQGVFRVWASLGGVTLGAAVSITSLVDITSSSAYYSPGGTPLSPLGTGRKINMYGETEAKGFEDYVALKYYQPGAKQYMRRLTKAPADAPPPDGPGLPDGCASDICMRGSPFHSPTYYAMRRIMRKDGRCRITFASEESQNRSFLAAFPDASLLQCWPTDVGSLARVIEFPAEPVWPRASDGPDPVIPSPDVGFMESPPKTRKYEGEP